MGAFLFEQFRHGEKIQEVQVANRIFTPFMTEVLEAMFNGGAAPSALYVGLIDAVGFSAIDDTDTMSSHPGWVEATGVQDYFNSAERRAFTVWNGRFTTPGDQTVVFDSYKSNIDIESVPLQIPGSNSRTLLTTTRATWVQGLFLSTDSTLGGTTGTLAAAAEFDIPLEMFPGDYGFIRYRIDFYSTLGEEFPWTI